MQPSQSAPHTLTNPSSSRMLASYLTDIEQLLDEQRWDAALREACDLPRIAVALSDPGLRCSGEDVGTWCAQWLPRSPSADAGTPEPLLKTPPAQHSGPAAVPALALRRLQLRRHVRTPPRGYRQSPDDSLDPQGAQSAETGLALIGAARRWYARSGCHDATVQSNLARLAVLR
jgi:hypothetical protein